MICYFYPYLCSGYVEYINIVKNMIIISVFVIAGVRTVMLEIYFYKKSVELTGKGEMIMGTAYSEKKANEFQNNELKKYTEICVRN